MNKSISDNVAMFKHSCRVSKNFNEILFLQNAAFTALNFTNCKHSKHAAVAV